MLIALGTIIVFTLICFLLRNRIPEKTLFILIPFLVAGVSSYLFWLVDYEIAKAQPLSEIEITYPLQKFPDGSYLYVEKGEDNNAYLLFDGRVIETKNVNVEKSITEEKPYIVERHERTREGSVWIFHDINVKTYILYLPTSN